MLGIRVKYDLFFFLPLLPFGLWKMENIARDGARKGHADVLLMYQTGTRAPGQAGPKRMLFFIVLRLEDHRQPLRS